MLFCKAVWGKNKHIGSYNFMKSLQSFLLQNQRRKWEASLPVSLDKTITNDIYISAGDFSTI